MSKSKNLLLGLGLIASQGLSAQQSDTLSTQLKQKIHDNFLLYKNTVGFPYDTIYSERGPIEEDADDPRSNILTTARGGKGYGHIVFNSKAPDKMISDQVILHELTHARKDTIFLPIDAYTLHDGAKIIGVNGLTFKLVFPGEGEATYFGLVEEAIAEYISRKISGKTESTLDPRYYALACFMKTLDQHKVITPKNMIYAIDHSDYKHILSIFGWENDPERADKLLGFFTTISNLGLDEDGKIEKNRDLVEQKVKSFTDKYIKTE